MCQAVYTAFRFPFVNCTPSRTTVDYVKYEINCKFNELV